MNMNGDRSNPLTILVIGAITVTSLVIWLGVLLVLWFVLRTAGIPADFWVMTEALSTAVAVAAVFVAGYYAYQELSEVTSTRHMEVADRLFEELNALENIEARRWVYKNLPNEPEEGIRSLSPEGKTAIKRVLNSLDRIAFLTQANWIPEDMVMPWMSTMIVKSWSKLVPYVEYESKRRGEPDYYANVRSLVERCFAWREKRLSAGEINWLEDAL